MTGAMGGHSVANISHHLKGIHFPAAKRELLRRARQNGADQDIMDLLDCIPDQEFQTVAEVTKAVREPERRGDGAER